MIEYSRNVLGLPNANSKEMEVSTDHPVVIEMPEYDPVFKGSTMRLGLRCTQVKEGSLA